MIENFLVRILGNNLAGMCCVVLMLIFISLSIPLYTKAFDYLFKWAKEREKLEDQIIALERRNESLENDLKYYKKR